MNAKPRFEPHSAFSHVFECPCGVGELPTLNADSESVWFQCDVCNRRGTPTPLGDGAGMRAAHAFNTRVAQ